MNECKCRSSCVYEILLITLMRDHVKRVKSHSSVFVLASGICLIRDSDRCGSEVGQLALYS